MKMYKNIDLKDIVSILLKMKYQKMKFLLW